MGCAQRTARRGHARRHLRRHPPGLVTRGPAPQKGSPVKLIPSNKPLEKIRLAIYNAGYESVSNLTYPIVENP